MLLVTLHKDPLAWLEDVDEQINTNHALRKLNMVPLTHLADLRISKADAIAEVEEEDEDDDDDWKYVVNRITSILSHERDT